MFQSDPPHDFIEQTVLRYRCQALHYVNGALTRERRFWDDPSDTQRPVVGYGKRGARFKNKWEVMVGMGGKIPYFSLYCNMLGVCDEDSGCDGLSCLDVTEGCGRQKCVQLLLAELL